MVTASAPAIAAGTAASSYSAVVFPLLLKRVYDDKDVAEQMVASGLDWTIARPGGLDQRPGDGALPRAGRAGEPGVPA